ncbi:DUF924 family protein [Acinetobacter radioresistens]|jgi:uncharacterized protein (DUF924 family)|uniref:DUF924 domain-containing protein n=2 Tax=Acinetobacter radioresistens TaxID=40216 RepID=A0A2T1J0R9_ACIRA|nr:MULTISPECIES: DUF924 family protein [Acinetobacter]AWV87609.1 DUF924 domain-containing protein [Acinetobacter radioresistens]EET82137.1 hypothetical protein ACIRA0001_0393 [Acinetobacter radioresistens SK82]EEY85915.1 hypothetical protein HMPREF0018_02495 [Acinetobacter radioresistens SH164]ENV85509.1 hypothetical protein F940_01730 [Acinetobacter radioresistens NIPH 2130]ENV90037.1 hypothetical protein F939_00723 [Acinetobacter radioresistens DSM 6976 = NBRC 102413 = CIP 103788]
MNYQEILDFWFNPEHQSLWFSKSDTFDQKIRQNFSKVHAQAVQAELWSWRKTADGRLAEIIVLDQFSRNLYRDQPLAFAQDGLALALAQEAISLNLDAQLNPEQRSFLYMPFMHSESKMMHEFALKLFQRLGNPVNLDYEKRHKKIIERFGRYPHRNKILGRESTPEELEFLDQPGSSF